MKSLNQTVENQRNPYIDLYHWIKGEVYDLNAFSAALIELKAASAAVESINKKIIATKADIDSLSAGKKTMSTMFKGSNDVHTIQNKLEQYEREADASHKLHSLILGYLGQQELPRFKADKLKLYSRIMQQFLVIEINNSHTSATYWSNLLKTPVVATANQVHEE